MSRFLAIDADAHGLFVASATLRSKGAIHLEQTAALADDTAALTPLNAEALGLRLKELLKEAKIKPAPVLLCIGRDRIILKSVHFPPTAPSDEPAIVRFQALRDLTENPDELVMDYLPDTSPLDGGERQAMVMFLRKSSLLAARTFCRAAGLQLAGLTPRPFAAAAALRHAFAIGSSPAPEDPSATLAVITFWDRGGEFAIVKGTEVLFTRTVPAHVLASESALIAELKRNLAVYSSQHPQSHVEAVYLAEPDDPGGGWAGRVQAAMPIPVHTFDPTAGSPNADQIPANLRGRLVGPVGLLVSQASAEILPINFMVPRQPRGDSGPVRKRAFLGALAGVLFFAMGGVFAYLEMDKADRRFKELASERDRLEDDLKRHELDAKRLAAADEFMNRSVNILDEMYDLSDRIPDVGKATVTEIDLQSLPPVKKDSRPGQAPSTGAAPVVPKNTPPQPVAQIRITLRTNDDRLAQRVADAFKNDKYYVGSSKTTGGQGDAGTKGQQYVLSAQIVPRKPGDYARQLRVQPPPKLTPPKSNLPGPDEFENFGGFGGGFGP